MELKQINDQLSVAGQITTEDVPAIKAAGFVTIVNNRPEGEAPDQPSGDDLRAAIENAGMHYHAIPMGREGVSPEMVAQTRSIIAQREGPVLCFCRTGTRSTTLWALSQAGQMDAETIITAAAKAGYDMSHLAAHLGAVEDE